MFLKSHFSKISEYFLQILRKTTTEIDVQADKLEIQKTQEE